MRPQDADADEMAKVYAQIDFFFFFFRRNSTSNSKLTYQPYQTGSTLSKKLALICYRLSYFVSRYLIKSAESSKYFAVNKILACPKKDADFGII